MRTYRHHHLVLAHPGNNWPRRRKAAKSNHKFPTKHPICSTSSASFSKLMLESLSYSVTIPRIATRTVRFERGTGHSTKYDCRLV